MGLLLAASVFVPGKLRADVHTFSNSFVSFHLPNSWDCELEQTEWVCNETKNAPHPAIIIIAAKEAGTGDTLDAYFDHLARQKMLQDQSGKPLRMSVVKSIERMVIGHQMWIVSTQFESELPNFYTQYYATVKGRVAVLVTLSAHQSVYRALQATFRDIVASLQVFDPLRPG